MVNNMIYVNIINVIFSHINKYDMTGLIELKFGIDSIILLGLI